MANSKLIGVGFAEHCRKVGELLEADHEANFQRRQNMAAEAERLAESIRKGSTYFAFVKPVWGGFQATTLEHPPLVGELSAVGPTPERACKELKFAYAEKLYAEKLVESFDDARAHASRSTFVQALEI
jgi:hypothetical protein